MNQCCEPMEKNVFDQKKNYFINSTKYFSK